MRVTKDESIHAHQNVHISMRKGCTWQMTAAIAWRLEEGKLEHRVGQLSQGEGRWWCKLSEQRQEECSCEQMSTFWWQWATEVSNKGETRHRDYGGWLPLQQW